MRGAAGWEQPFFRLESFSVDTDHRSGSNARLWNDVAVAVETQATVKIDVGGDRRVAVGEGNGPVNALDAALRTALQRDYPALERISLTDFKVRVLDTGKGTGAVTRVLLDSTDGEREWTTIGVSENIIEASWQALVDSLVYGLLHASEQTVRPRSRHPAGRVRSGTSGLRRVGSGRRSRPRRQHRAGRR